MLPEGFAEGVMSAIAASAPKAKKRPTPWKKVLIPMAACLALVVMAMPLRDMMGGNAEEAMAEASPAMMESPAETAVEAPAKMPAEEPAEAPAAEAGEGVAAPTAAAEEMQYTVCTPEEESSAKEGRIAAESRPYADMSDPEMPAATTGGPVATITLPPEGAQLELLIDRAPDRETDSRMEFDLPAADYETLLNQLDESGLDYLAEEHTGSTGDTILVIIELELASQN